MNLIFRPQCWVFKVLLTFRGKAKHAVAFNPRVTRLGMNNLLQSSYCNRSSSRWFVYLSGCAQNYLFMNMLKTLSPLEMLLFHMNTLIGSFVTCWRFRQRRRLNRLKEKQRSSKHEVLEDWIGSQAYKHPRNTQALLKHAEKKSITMTIAASWDCETIADLLGRMWWLNDNWAQMIITLKLLQTKCLYEQYNKQRRQSRRSRRIFKSTDSLRPITFWWKPQLQHRPGF